jgi:hypothetical protein
MRRLLLTAVTIAFTLTPTTGAPAAVDQFRDSAHHEIESGHDVNICGDLATFTFDVTWRVHAVENRETFQAAYSESFKYSLVFDDPSLGTWTGHGAETINFVENASGTIFHEIFNSKEGPVLIVEHLQFHTDAEGNVTVDREFDRVVGC